jgi:hypothetical protein
MPRKDKTPDELFDEIKQRSELHETIKRLGWLEAVLNGVPAKNPPPTTSTFPAGMTGTVPEKQKQIYPGKGRGLRRKFGDDVLKHWKSGKLLHGVTITGGSKTAAMKMACAAFRPEEGGPFDAKAILQSLANRDDPDKEGKGADVKRINRPRSM